MPLTIRPLAEADREQWEPLWIGYQTFYKRTLSPEMIDLSWRRFMNPAVPLDAFGAFDGTRMVGLVHTGIQWLTSFEKPACYLSDLFTDPDVRGSGAGRAMIEYVYDHAREKGCARVYWLTHETNTNAMLLYDRIAQKSGFLHYWNQL